MRPRSRFEPVQVSPKGAEGAQNRAEVSPKVSPLVEKELKLEGQEARHAAAGTGLELVLTALVVLLLLGLMALA